MGSLAAGRQMRLLIITPLFFGEGSGASVYYNMLARQLLGCCSVTVISDREKGCSPCGYYALFPKRCGRRKRKFRDLLFYALQNLTYMLIPFIVLRERPSVVLVHSSFYNFPGVFPFSVWLTERLWPRGKFILDVRDRLFPARSIGLLHGYEKVIACSENTRLHMLRVGLEASKVMMIPVIQEPFQLSKESADVFIKDVGLAGKKYVFYAGLVKESKAVDLLLYTYVHYLRPANPNLFLVISGIMKTTSSSLRKMMENDGVIYLGNLSRDGVLKLMFRATVCVNLSPSEGMPRSSLEALALRRPVILPPNVPEFKKYCPNQVMHSKKPRDISEKIMQMVNGEGGEGSYPIDQHYPESVIPLYWQLFGVS